VYAVKCGIRALQHKQWLSIRAIKC
jgi:hypothetical protein